MTEIMNELERVISTSGFLDNATFKWVGITLRYGLKNETKPHYQGIDKKDGELAVAIELDTRELRYANRDELKELFMIATLKTLVHVGHKYELSYGRFVELLNHWQALRAERLKSDSTQTRE